MKRTLISTALALALGAGAASAYVLAMIVSLLAIVYVTFIYRRVTA